MKCLICDMKSEETSKFKVIVLTPEEKLGMETTLDEYPYCKPCWGILSDPIRGPILMKGLAQQRMRLSGVSAPVAEVLADRYYKGLVSHIVKSKQKT